MGHQKIMQNFELEFHPPDALASRCVYKTQLQDRTSQFLLKLHEKTHDSSPLYSAQPHQCSSTELGNHSTTRR